MAHDRRYLDDKESFQALVDDMRNPDKDEFESYRFMAKESAFPSRRLVVYTLKSGKPSDIELIQFGEIAVGVKETPTVRMFFRNRDMYITPTPMRVPNREVFLCVPQNFTFRWAGQEGDGSLEFRAHYAILIKTRSRDNLAIEGHTYCVSLKRFLETYPQHADEVRF